MGRPPKLNSKTYHKYVACCDLYITITFRERDNKPYECFIQAKASTLPDEIIDGKEIRKNKKIKGGCSALQQGLAELVTITLQNDKLEETIDSLRQIKCNACDRIKGKFPQEYKKVICFSCPDAIGRVLENWVDEDSKK